MAREGREGVNVSIRQVLRDGHRMAETMKITYLCRSLFAKEHYD